MKPRLRRSSISASRQTNRPFSGSTTRQWQKSPKSCSRTQRAPIASDASSVLVGSGTTAVTCVPNARVGPQLAVALGKHAEPDFARRRRVAGPHADAIHAGLVRREADAVGHAGLHGPGDTSAPAATRGLRACRSAGSSPTARRSPRAPSPRRARPHGTSAWASRRRPRRPGRADSRSPRLPRSARRRARWCRSARSARRSLPTCWAARCR